MSLLVQSGGESIRTANACGHSISAPVPPALTAGDVLAVLISAREEGEITPADPESIDWHSVSHASNGGTHALFHVHLPTSSSAARVRDLGSIDFTLAGENHRCVTAIAFRVTGADPVRFVESSIASVGTLAADGHLTIPSLDPEHRRDNAVLFVASLGYGQDVQRPSSVVGRAAPLVTVDFTADGETGMNSMTTTLSSRPLSSSDPTGEHQVSVTAEAPVAFAAAFMLRSENRLPEIHVPVEWAGEVGRPLTVEATITDPDQTPVSYVWSAEGGPEVLDIANIYSRAFTFTPSAPGIYEFTLTATDVDGGRTQAQTRVVVPTGRAAPATIVVSEGWEDQDGNVKPDPVILGDASDATFARTVSLPTGRPLTMGLPPIYGGAAVTLVIRGAQTNPSPSLNRTVILRQDDGTLIAERSYPLSTEMRSFVFTTSRAETASITSRSAMTVTIIDEVA